MELSTFQAVILGLVQGLGEFLPISSSGHLMLAQHFLGRPDIEQMKAFDVLLHLATLLALLAYFRDDLKTMCAAWARSLRATLRPGGWAALGGDPQAKWGWLVLITLPPTIVVALGLAKPLDRVFEAHEWLVGLMLLIAGTSNYFSALRVRAGGGGRPIEAMTTRDSLLCGVGQGLSAVFHGISRSGTTMACGLACGLAPEAAPRFSFLMAVPATAGAVLYEVPRLFQPGAHQPELFPAAVAFVVAGVTGYLAVRTVFNVVRRGRFASFAYYCWTVGLVALVALALGA
ncbi:MAG: undecaprenyl-diphosphate phosphatase [Armatimonadetes bacterium]|nr:undecaprenyl-diphosphate phosphatase [Armatimonadota bacterium]